VVLVVYPSMESQAATRFARSKAAMTVVGDEPKGLSQGSVGENVSMYSEKLQRQL